MRVSPNARAVCLASFGYIALSIAYTWPLAIRLTGVPHDLGDPLLTTWFLWWSATQALPLTTRWWNAPIFYPATGAFGFSEHLLGLVPIALPLIVLTHQPLVGNNVAFIATFALSALGAHFLAYTLTRRHDVSVVAAIAFAFAPYRLAQTPHIQVLSSFWTPVCLAALHRYGREFRARWAIVAAAAWVLQSLSCGYYMFYLLVLTALWILWFAVGRWPVRRLAVVGTAFAAGAALLAPFLLGYQHILKDTYNFMRSIGEIRYFGADLAALLSAPEDLLAWNWVHVIQRPEANLFPGPTIVLLIAFAVCRRAPLIVDETASRRLRVLRAVLTGLFVLLATAAAIPMAAGSWQLTIGGLRVVSIARADKPMTLAVLTALALVATLPAVRRAFNRRSVLAFYLLAAFAMWVFALGPDPTLMGRRALYRAPYAWLMLLPGFDGMRVPARFWMMAIACLSVVAALSLHRLSGRVRRVTVALAVCGLIVDGWPGRFVVWPAPPIRPSPAGVVARLDLPMTDETDPQALYQQMFDPIPLYNGFSGYVAPHYYAMRMLVEEADPRILQVMTAGGELGVVIDHAGDPDGALRRFVLSAPGSTVERVERDWSSYRLPRTVNLPAADEESGASIRITSFSASPGTVHAERALDGNLLTNWEGGSQEQPAEAVIELESPTHVGQLVIDLGRWVRDFPTRLQIDVSADGAAWHTAWTGGTALQAYYGAIRHPREMPMVFAIGRDDVRFMRLRQIGVGKHEWSIAELHVLR